MICLSIYHCRADECMPGGCFRADPHREIPVALGPAPRKNGAYKDKIAGATRPLNKILAARESVKIRVVRLTRLQPPNAT